MLIIENRKDRKAMLEASTQNLKKKDEIKLKKKKQQQQNEKIKITEINNKKTENW